MILGVTLLFLLVQGVHLAPELGLFDQVAAVLIRLVPVGNDAPWKHYTSRARGHRRVWLSRKLPAL